jgi:tetratricopeptide (TPR) repeat protein
MPSSAVYQDNPYVIGVPIDDRRFFYGRERLFDYVRDNLSSGAKVILLSGQRRIGKSSVLRQILNFVELTNFAFVYYDLEASTRVPLGKLLSNIGEEIVKRLNVDPAKVNALSPGELEADPTGFVSRFLPQVYALLGEKKLVLLLDEFDALDGEIGDYAAGRFFPFLQSVIDIDPRLYVIPIVGRRLDQIERLPPRFLSAPHQEIKLLDDNSARRLITEPVAGVLVYTEEAVKAILDLTSGHPYFTQLICFSVFQRARDEHEWTVLPEHVKSVLKDAMVSGEGGLVGFRLALPIPERVVFSAIAELQEFRTAARLNSIPRTYGAGRIVPDLLASYGVTPNEELATAEKKLLEWGFVKESDQGLYARIVTVEFVRRWLVQNYPLRGEIFELEKQAPEAQNAYESALQAIKRGDQQAAIDLCEHALAVNPNHLHAVAELAELYLEHDDFAQAVQYYTRAYFADPGLHKEGFVQALVGHARDLIRDGAYELAKQESIQALELSPDNPKLRQRLDQAEAGLRRTLVVQNPFFVGNGVPPDRFVGRSEEVSKLLSLMAQQGNMAIHGEAGMGKTALLQYVSSPEVLKAHQLNPAQSITIYVNCQSLAPFSPGGLWNLVFLELEKRVGSGATPATRDPLEPIAVLREIAGQGRHVVLLLDEFETALQPNPVYSDTAVWAFMANLRSMMLSGRDLTVVVATRRSLVQLAPSAGPAGSPLFNAFQFSSLLPFTKSEIEELVAKMPPAAGSLSEMEQGWLFEVSGGYPFVVQLALSILFRYHVNRSPFDLSAAMQELAAAVDAPFTALWSGLSTTEQDLLSIVGILHARWRVNGLSRTPFTLRARVLEDLRNRGLLMAEGRTSRIVSSMLEWWILKRLEVQDSQEIEDFVDRVEAMQGNPENKLQRLFGIFSAEKKIPDLIREVWNRKAAMRSIEAWGQAVSERGATL